MGFVAVLNADSACATVPARVPTPAIAASSCLSAAIACDASKPSFEMISLLKIRSLPQVRGVDSFAGHGLTWRGLAPSSGMALPATHETWKNTLSPRSDSMNPKSEFARITQPCSRPLSLSRIRTPFASKPFGDSSGDNSTRVPAIPTNEIHSAN